MQRFIRLLLQHRLHDRALVCSLIRPDPRFCCSMLCRFRLERLFDQTLWSLRNFWFLSVGIMLQFCATILVCCRVFTKFSRLIERYKSASTHAQMARVTEMRAMSYCRVQCGFRIRYALLTHDCLRKQQLFISNYLVSSDIQASVDAQLWFLKNYEVVE